MLSTNSSRFCALRLIIVLGTLSVAFAWPKIHSLRKSSTIASLDSLGNDQASVLHEPQDAISNTTHPLVTTSASILPTSSLAEPNAAGPSIVVSGISSTTTLPPRVNGKHNAHLGPIKRSVAIVTQTVTEIDWAPIYPSSSLNGKGAAVSYSAISSSPSASKVVSSTQLPIDPDATTTVLYGHTVIIVPPWATSAFPQVSFSPSSTSEPLRPTDTISTNASHYPSHDKVKKIAEIVVPSVVGGSLGVGAVYKIGKWTWEAIDKLQRFSNQPYSTDQLIRMMINAHDDEEFRHNGGETQEAAEAEERSVAETESYLMESEAESPGLVLTEEAKAAIQRVLGQHACTLQGSQFAPYPPGFEPLSSPGSETPPNGPSVPDGDPPSSGGSTPGSQSPPNGPPGPQNPPASPPSGPGSSSGSDNPPTGPRIPGLPPIPWLNPPSGPGHSGPDTPEGPGKGSPPPNVPDTESSSPPSSTSWSVSESSPVSKSKPKVSSSSSSAWQIQPSVFSLAPSAPSLIAISKLLPASLAPLPSIPPITIPRPSITFYTLSPSLETIPISSSSSASPTPSLASSPAQTTTLPPSPSPPPKPSPGLKKPACRHKIWKNCCIYEGGRKDGLRYCFA